MSTAKTSDEGLIRKGRVAESRNWEMREAEIRQKLQMAFSDPLHIDPNSIPDDMEYFWGRDSVNGLVDNARITQLKKRGWVPVMADERPDLVNPEFEGRETVLKGYIHYKGAILMKRPKAWGDVERKMEAEASYEAMLSLPHNDLKSATKNAGWESRIFQNETSVVKTATFKD